MPRGSDKNATRGKTERAKDSSPREIIGKFFDDDFWLDPFGPWRGPQLIPGLDRRWFPRIDISETDTDVKVVADVPGIDPNDIDIDVRNNRMRIRGRTVRTSAAKERPYRYERSYGEFSREFTLPAHVKEDQVKAVYKDGVLTIGLPKAEEELRSKIKIEKEI